MGGYGMAAKMRELTEQNIQEFVKEVENRKIPLHSVLIAQHGNLLFEKYYAPYCRNKLQRMFSVTKSFTSLAIGLLEQEGKISLQDPICDYFPEYLPGRVHPWLAEMTIENMLKMQTCYNMTTYNKTSTTENWVRSFFQTEPTHRPGTLFMYDTSSSHVLCALVEKLTGEKMLDYLKENAGELSWEQVSKIFPPLFTTIGILHNAGIIHRAISPDTVYITDKGELKLSGFCVSAVRTVDAGLEYELFKGYAAPEQYSASSSSRQGSWTDVYGVSALLYRALTGCMPVDSVSR